MQFNRNVFNAVLNHVYTAAGVAVTVLAAVGMSQGDATAIGVAVHQIGDGVVSVVAGVTTLLTIGSGAYAGYMATRKAQLTSVAAVPGTVVRIPDQKLANELPSNVRGPLDGPIG